ncbi:MAG: capsular biosynthesis protein [Desulfuromonas sp.]|uniref:tyrosine-protein phosphatase n=1 Tax=Desulfuromonas sp. TaxID=892 RepID=UPI000CC7FD93|nr:CpsB/CapC family capsule biosynthesis tyrosine phosphatase [Desulfuromonas sp.]PLX84639.1 MAG: capsular biosynthesis protein [Desulfuromonas sp.]
MIDLHCHILHDIDDGPSTLEESLEMARMAVADGIEHIVATPHVREVIHDPEDIRDRVNRFRSALQDAGIPLEISPGGDNSALLDVDTLKGHTINGTDYVLLEFPYTHLPHNARDMIYRIQLAGLLPIITHPERNPSIIAKPQLLINLAEAGAFVQVTAESLTGGFGRKVKKCAQYLLKNHAVHILASDAHSPGSRPPILSKGVKAAAKIVGEPSARRLVTTNPAAVMSNKPIHD